MVNGCGDCGHNAQLAVELELGTEQQPPAMDLSMLESHAVGVGQRQKIALVNIFILYQSQFQSLSLLH